MNERKFESTGETVKFYDVILILLSNLIENEVVLS